MTIICNPNLSDLQILLHVNYLHSFGAHGTFTLPGRAESQRQTLWTSNSYRLLSGPSWESLPMLIERLS